MRTNTLTVGDTTQATPSLRDAEGRPFTLKGAAITWTSSDPTVAQVSTTGLVSAVSPGTSKITASADNVSADATVTVVAQGPAAVASVAVTLGTSTLTAGQTTQAVATPKDAGGNALLDRAVTFTSSNPSVATVSATGLVTSVAAGTTSITATCEGQFGSAALTVVAPPPASSITVTFDSSSVVVGSQAHSTATVADSSGDVLSGSTVTWSSSNTAVATVSATGVVTAVALGTTTITATSGAASGSAIFTVIPTPVATVKIFLNSPISVLDKVQAVALTYDGAGNALSGRLVTWSSSAPAIATISSTGSITGVAVGTTTITATSEGKSAAAPLIVVTPPPTPSATITVTIDSTALTVPHQAHATATIRDGNGNVISGSVSWSSSNSSIASVSSTGLITAVGGGTATITATGGSGTTAGHASIVISGPSSGGSGVLASHDFEDGTLGPYTDPYETFGAPGADIDVINDPTGFGHGKILRIHYVGNNQDRNRAIQFEYPPEIGLGQSIFFKGDLYLPPGLDTIPQDYQRKLLYWQRSLEYSDGPDFAAVLDMYGNFMQSSEDYVPAVGPVVTRVANSIAVLKRGQWNTIEYQVTLNSAPSTHDGIVRVWVNGTLVHEETDVTFSDPAWTSPASHQTLRYFLVGDQVNSSLAYDEYRYWDNISFGTVRLP